MSILFLIYLYHLDMIFYIVIYLISVYNRKFCVLQSLTVNAGFMYGSSKFNVSRLQYHLYMAVEGFILIETHSGKTSSASKDDICLKKNLKLKQTQDDIRSGLQWERSLPLAHINGIEALCYHVLMGMKPSATMY